MAQNKMVDPNKFSILPFIGKHNVPSKSSYTGKLKPSLTRRGAGQAGVRVSSTISPTSSDSTPLTRRTTNSSTPSAQPPRLKVRAASDKARLSTRLSPAKGGNVSLSPSFASNVPTRRNSKEGYSRRPSMDYVRKSRHRSKILKDTSETVLESYDIQPTPSPSFPLIGKLQDMPFADIKKFIEDIASPLFRGPKSVSSSFLTAPELEVHLEDMSAKAMKRLEYVFKVAEERDGPLTYDTFRSVLQAVLGHRVAEKELKIMFMKIDTNCDETVSWSEYLSFILCELQKKDLMKSTKNDNPLPDEISSTIHSRHHNFITRIRFSPALLNRGSRNERWDKSLGKYISLSLDGTVCFWSQKMECKRVHSLHQSRVSAPIYCTDLVAMANVNYIAVSTSHSDIRFYELSGQQRFERMMTLSHHKHLVLCMDYWFDEANMDKARLFWGDAGGNVFVLTFWKCIDGGPFGNVSGSRNISLGQLLADVQYGQKNRYHAHKLKRLHLDWVRAIRYVAELDAVVSSCGETTTAMACTALHDMKSKLFVVHKGVICFDYSNNQNLLVSGGIEQNVRGWNPFINTGPIFRLKGTNAVVHLMVNNERDLCISISLDKNVSIFSLKDQTLVQLIPPRSFPKMIGHKPITSAYFNNDTQVLVVGTTDLSVFLPDLEKEVSLRSNTHESDLCGVLFNPLYDLIVSGSVGSSVCVWDARTGEKKLMFDKAHTTTVYNKEKVIDLTAMSFDYTKRRLVTGGRDGTVKIWNFHNGDCLQVMQTQGQMEVTQSMVTHGMHSNYTFPNSYRIIAKGFRLKRQLFDCKHNATSSRKYFEQIIVEEYENKPNNYYISDVPEDDKYAIIVFLCLIGLVGFTLNLIQLIYIVKRIRAKKKLTMDYFLISLTIGDLYRSGPSMTVAAYLWYEEFSWRSLEPVSNNFCKLTAFGSFVARTIGLSSMCTIAVARLLAIRWPMMVEKIKVSSRVTSIVQVVIIWLLVIAVSVPTIYYSNTDVWALKPNMTMLQEDPQHYRPVFMNDASTPDSCADYARFCTVSTHNGDGSVLERVYWWLNVIAFVSIPQAILLFSYTFIIVTLVKRRKERKTMFSNSDPVFVATTNKRDREAIVSALLGGVYGMISLPMLLYAIFDPLPYTSLKIYDPVRTGLSTLERLTVITNPLIYTFFSPSFTKQKKTFCSSLFSKLGFDRHSRPEIKDASCESSSNLNVDTLETTASSH